MSIRKISQELDKAFELGKKENPSKHKVVAKNYLAMLKALREYYHFAHWVSKKDPFYSDHSLFQRLYQELDEEIDGAAEKFIGLMDEEVVHVTEINKMMCDIYEKLEVPKSKDVDGAELAKCGLKLESAFLRLSEKMYDDMKKDNSITLGLDDMIMSNFNNHEDTIYLLKQRVK